MKTLVLLCALVSIAIAAPAQPGDGLEDTKRTQDWHIQPQTLSTLTRREKKSPSEITATSLLTTAATNSETQNVHHIDSTVSTPMGRSFGLKKPLIVKKKYGYRLYRDSEEEKAQADSQESCGRQVRVKLCDEDIKFKNEMKTTAVGENTNMAEDDVKHSIKMAKEAVENLQRDLMKMEVKAGMKTAHESEADADLHEDIEIARKALEHIHENFGNLESMSLHATAARDSESLHDIQVTIAKTEEERMAQWKEAMENIQKNVEIAKNIEDSFKAASHHESFLNVDHPQPAITLGTHNIEDKFESLPTVKTESLMRAVEKEDLKKHHWETKNAEEKLLVDDKHEHLTGVNAREEQNFETDMSSAASGIIETHMDTKTSESLRSEGLENHVQEKAAEVHLGEHDLHHTHLEDLETQEHNLDHIQQEKSSESHMDMLTDQSELHMSELPFMKEAEKDETVPTKSNTEKEVMFKTSEMIPETTKDLHLNGQVTGTNIIEPLNLDAFSEQQKIAENMNLEKNAWETTDDMIDFLAKASNNLEEGIKQKQNVHTDTTQIEELGKSAESLKPEQEETIAVSWNVKPKVAVESLVIENKHDEKLIPLEKSVETVDLTSLHNIPEQTENFMLAKSADHVSLHDRHLKHMIEHDEPLHIESEPTMKAAEGHLHHLEHMHNTHWGHEAGHLDHLSSMKAAEGIRKDFDVTHGHGHGFIDEHSLDHLRNSHMAEHGIPSKMSAAHDFELGTHGQLHAHHPSRYHYNQMTHSQMHDMNSMSAMHSKFHPSMRDAMEGLGSEHTFRWRPSHESGRVAYGSGLSSSIGSSGAVGVFPNANTGGCGIPLLLSCSPSVVSGSLAKTHSAAPASYSAPSYRTDEEFVFHNKRDIKKTNDLRTTTNTHRTPTIVKQKNQILVEKKM